MPVVQQMVRYTWQNQVMANTLTYDAVVTGPDGWVELADRFKGLWSTHLRQYMSSTLVMVDTVVSFISQDPIWSIVVPFSTGPIAGQAVAQELPAQIAALVSLQYQGPPPNRGRVYLTGLTESELNNGLWTAPLVEAMEDWGAAMAQTIIGDAIAGNWVITRRNAQGQATDSNPVTSVVARAVPATQRRRRIGVGS